MNVYILGGLRTPIVVAGTKFKTLRPEIFGAEVLKALRQNFLLEGVDEVICGGGNRFEIDSAGARKVLITIAGGEANS